MFHFFRKESSPLLLLWLLGRARRNSSVNAKKPRSLLPAFLPPAVGMVELGPAVPAADSQSILFPASFPSPALRDPTPTPFTPSLSLEPLPHASFTGKIPAVAHSALRHLSPLFLLLSVFQKCVEIPHLLTPTSPLLIVGLYLFCSFTIILKGAWEEGEISTCALSM